MKNAIVFVSASRDWMETNFLFEFLRLNKPSDWNLTSSKLAGHCAADRHNEAFNCTKGFENLQKLRFDRILFMDSDQFYPYDYLIKMLAHTEPVVASWSVSRWPPYEIGQYNNAGFKTVDGVTFPDYQPIDQELIVEDIFECDAVGLGASMIDRDLIDLIKPPWFKDLIDSQGIRLLCDDFYFFNLLNNAGYKVTVDRDIMIGHYTVALILPSNRHLIYEANHKCKLYKGEIS